MIKKNIAFAFPGAGIDIKGFEKDFFLRHKNILSPFLEEASDYIKVNLIKCIEDEEKMLSKDRINQFFVYSYSAGAASVFIEKLYPEITSGYSFGAYAALYIAGAINFHSGLKIIDKAYDCMKEACLTIKAGMCAVIGLSENSIDAIIKDNDLSSLHIVNSNNDTCKIVAGIKNEIISFKKYAEKQEALNIISLNVDFPYHHPFLQDKISYKFKNFIKTLPWHDSNIPFISSINQKLLTQKEDLSTFIIEQLSTPINWEKVITSLSEKKIKTIIECGPGISLTQNGRFIQSKPLYVNIKNCQRRMGF